MSKVFRHKFQENKSLPALPCHPSLSSFLLFPVLFLLLPCPHSCSSLPSFLLFSVLLPALLCPPSCSSLFSFLLFPALFTGFLSFPSYSSLFSFLLFPVFLPTMFPSLLLVTLPTLLPVVNLTLYTLPSLLPSLLPPSCSSFFLYTSPLLTCFLHPFTHLIDSFFTFLPCPILSIYSKIDYRIYTAPGSNTETDMVFRNMKQ